MWTKKLQQLTRDHFENVMKGGMMKHYGDSKFGLGVFMSEKYIIHVLDSDEVCEYTTMDEMLDSLMIGR